MDHDIAHIACRRSSAPALTRMSRAKKKADRKDMKKNRFEPAITCGFPFLAPMSSLEESVTKRESHNDMGCRGESNEKRVPQVNGLHLNRKEWDGAHQLVDWPTFVGWLESRRVQKSG